MHVVGNELMNYAYWGLEKTIKYHAFCMGPAHFFFPSSWMMWLRAKESEMLSQDVVGKAYLHF